MRFLNSPLPGTPVPTVVEPGAALPPYVPITNGDSQDRSDELREHLLVARRHLWLILFITVAIAGMAAFYVARIPPQFSADGSVRVTSDRAEVGGISARPGGNMAATGDPVVSAIQLLKSRRVTSRVAARHPLGLRVVSEDVPLGLLRIDRLDSLVALEKVGLTFAEEEFTAQAAGLRRRASYGSPVEFPGMIFTVRAPPEEEITAGEIAVISAQAAGARLSREVDATARRNGNVIDVRYVGSDPAVTAGIVAALLREFADHAAQSAQDLARRRREFLAAQLARSESLFAEAGRQLASFRATQQGVSSLDRLNIAQSGLLELESRREELLAERQLITSSVARMERAQQGAERDEALQAALAATSVGNNTTITGLYSRLASLQRSRDSMSIGPYRAAASNPDLQRVERQIAQLHQQLHTALKSIVVAVDGRVAGLERLRQDRMRELQTVPASAAAERRLIENEQMLTRRLEDVRAQYDVARMGEAISIGAIDVLDLPFGASRIPRRGVAKVSFALFVGLGFGFLVALFLERLNTSVRTRDEVERLLHVPALAVVPAFEVTTARRWLRRLPYRSANGNGAATAGSALVVSPENRSVPAEAFRGLRTSILFTEYGNAIRSIVVTSPGAGEGKTTTAANLATAFANQGRRVVLVDCDLRRPRLHKIFEVPEEPGLTHAMLGYSTLPDVTRETAVAGLSLIPAGRMPPDPAEMFGSARAQEVLAQLMAGYDLLVLDTPPLLLSSETRILAQMAGGTVLVLRAGQTKRNESTQALAQLRSVGARVLGAVLNDPDSAGKAYGEYYNYYYAHQPTA